MTSFRVDTPLATLGVTMDGDAVTAIRFHDASDDPPTSAGGERVARQLVEYAEGRRRQFDFPIAPAGTPFQRAVWDALCAIPFGETRTYGEIATAIGRPGAARAVGMANHHNPIPIVIPCHRVIGADGSLTGFGGGLDLKERLLSLEGTQVGAVQLGFL